MFFRPASPPPYPWPSLLHTQPQRNLLYPAIPGGLGGPSSPPWGPWAGGRQLLSIPCPSTWSSLRKGPFALRAPLHPGAAPGLPEARPASSSPYAWPSLPKPSRSLWPLSGGRLLFSILLLPKSTEGHCSSPLRGLPEGGHSSPPHIPEWVVSPGAAPGLPEARSSTASLPSEYPSREASGVGGHARRPWGHVRGVLSVGISFSLDILLSIIV